MQAYQRKGTTIPCAERDNIYHWDQCCLSTTDGLNLTSTILIQHPCWSVHMFKDCFIVTHYLDANFSKAAFAPIRNTTSVPVCNLNHRSVLEILNTHMVGKLEAARRNTSWAAIWHYYCLLDLCHKPRLNKPVLGLFTEQRCSTVTDACHVPPGVQVYSLEVSELPQKHRTHLKKLRGVFPPTPPSKEVKFVFSDSDYKLQDQTIIVKHVNNLHCFSWCTTWWPIPSSVAG